MGSLKEGFSILYDMELNNYLMTQMIAELNGQINSLGHKKNINQPYKEQNNVAMSDYTLPFLGVGGFLGAIIGAIVGFVDANSFIEYIFSPLEEGIKFALIFAAIGLAFGFFVGIICRKKKYAEIEKNYSSNCIDAEKRIKNDAIRVQNELKQKEILIHQRQALMTRKNEATQRLNKFYSIMNIDSKYRHIIPIGYMNEFVSLGISNKLEGVDGLYYLIRQELRMDQFQYTLDEISSKLDTIIDNQHRLYGELKNLNTKCDTLISATVKTAQLAAKNNQLLQQVVENTSITAYNSERIKAELRFQNYMMTY